MNKKRIILIEDDPFLSEMYVTKFHQEGFEVDVAINGEKGLKIIKEQKPDLILLDIVLPKMDGFETLRALKKNKALKDIPVILLTNLSQENEVKKGVELGASDYLVKAHFTPTEVVEKVKDILNQEAQAIKHKT